MYTLIWFALPLWIAFSAIPFSEPPIPGRRLAVMDLDDGQVRAAAKEIFGRDLELGHGVRGLVANHLKRSGYTIVEWRALDQALTSQGLPPEKRSGPAGAKRVTQVVAGSVDGIVLGSIQQLGRDKKSSVKAIGPSGEAVPFSSTDRQTAAIELRLMDARTGEVVLTCEGRGVSTGAGQSVFRPKGGGRMTGSGIDFTSPEFVKSMPGEAITKAVEEAGARLAEAKWIAREQTDAPGPASQLLAVMLMKEIESRRAKGFDEDLAIQTSSADLRVGRTVFVHPMTYDFHLAVVDALRKAKTPLFEVVDDPRAADLWIRGEAGFSGMMKLFSAELRIVPRGSENVLWSGKARSGGYNPYKETEADALAKKMVRQIRKSMGLPEK
ncbi:MAG: CsgG/HfaB family protein [Acidobacteriales bacterium]|nr:CsgG/HfaB family protein [Terriglobales bacterium]